ncbi:uncharacterized protein [Macrobrachium rosenbergii]|uniref:uncharacterized protein n=1 Tax=Macrobrachium rosenbergii TaxID=79674 RepID=UPI0034D3D549
MENKSSNSNTDPPPYFTHVRAKPKPIHDDVNEDIGVKRLLEKSLIMINRADSCLGYYDVTLRDGTSGTIVRTAPDTLFSVYSCSSSPSPSPSPLLLLPPPPPPPPPPPLQPPPAPRIGNENQCIISDKKELDKSTLHPVNKVSGVVSPGAQRPGGRHHLIDIHGLAIFLRQSTRCLSCKGACCLYVTGAISAQLGAITKVKITCQDCNYTASQSLLRPSQLPDDMGTSQFMLSSETPTSTPPSKTPSPHHPTSPMELLTTPDTNSHVLGKDAKDNKKNVGKYLSNCGNICGDASCCPMMQKLPVSCI